MTTRQFPMNTRVKPIRPSAAYHINVIPYQERITSTTPGQTFHKGEQARLIDTATGETLILTARHATRNDVTRWDVVKRITEPPDEV